MTLRSATLIVAFSATLAACSASNNPTLTPQPSPKPTIGPASWKVTAGSETSNEAIQALAYYPASITIDAGDTVTWTAPSDEPHTISIPIPGQSPPPVSDPSATLVVGGSTYDTTAYISSGFIGGGATYSVTFTKPGTYSYYSLPQGFVMGTVVVQAAGTAYPQTQSGYDTLAASEIANDYSIAENSLVSNPFAAGTSMIAAGVSPAGGAPADGTVMRFLQGPTLTDDENVTVAVGTTVTWKNLSNNVPHTVTFPAVGATPPPGPPSQAAVGGSTYDGTSLVNSGVIPPGSSYQLTFTKAGTFTYYCLFHEGGEGMIAQITVR